MYDNRCIYRSAKYVRVACFSLKGVEEERIPILGSGAHEVAGSSPVFPTIGDTCILLSLSGVGSKKNW